MKCILRNDNDFFSLLKNEILQHMEGKCFSKEDSMKRLIHSATCLEDLELIIEPLNNYMCRFSWYIVEVELP